MGRNSAGDRAGSARNDRRRKSGQVESALCRGVKSGGTVERRSIRVLEEFRRGAGYVFDRDCGDGGCGFAGSERLRKIWNVHEYLWRRPVGEKGRRGDGNEIRF